MQKIGYSLLLLLVYCSISFFLITIMLHYCLQTQRVQKRSYISMNKSITAAVAIDLLIRDIEQAPAEIVSWKSRHEDCLIWKKERHDIGWCIEDGMLVRSEGLYDMNKKSWHHRRKSAIGSMICSVKALFYYDTANSHIIAIHVTVRDGEKEIRETTISLMNGELS